MKTFRLLSLVMAFLLALGSVAFADVINMPSANDENSTITVTGTIPGATYGDSVGVYVLKPGKAVADIDVTESGKFMEALAGYVSALCDREGNYSAVIGLEDAPQGNYTVVASSKKLSVDEIFTYFYASNGAKLGFIGELKFEFQKPGSTPSDLKAKLNLALNEESDTAKLLGIGASDIILKVDEDGLAAVLYAMAKADSDIFNVEYASDFVVDLSLAALIQSLNEGWGDVNDTRLGLDKKFYATYEGLSETAKDSFVYDYLKGKGMLSLTDVNNYFCDGVILAALKDAKGWKDYEKIIANHGENIAINMKGYAKLKKPSDVTNELADKYTSVDKFVKDVNKAINNLLEEKKGTSGGSSGGGGGLSVGGTLPSADVPLDSFESAKISFSDVPDDHWAAESILALAQTGAIAGKGDGTFAPDMDVTREEFVKMAVVALGITVDASSVCSYTDVKASAWYAPYLAAAEKEGIVSGIGEGMFGVGRTITRQEAATILHRIGVKLGKTFTSATLPFQDDSSIADFAKEAVYALKGEGIINGVTAREFAPLANCSRAQSAKLIYGLAGKE